MAYPEPTPALWGKKAKAFIERLEAFELTDAQQRLYAGARSLYRKLRPRS